MSSMVRRIQRTVKRAKKVWCKAPHYLGRGKWLGTKNPRAPKPNSSPPRGSRRGKSTSLTKPIIIGSTAPRNCPDLDAHRNKMIFKRDERATRPGNPVGDGRPDHFSIWPEGKTATPARMGAY